MARELQAREKEKKEQELRELAMRARAERGGAGAYAPPPAAARYPRLAIPDLATTSVGKKQPFVSLTFYSAVAQRPTRITWCSAAAQSATLSATAFTKGNSPLMNIMLLGCSVDCY